MATGKKLATLVGCNYPNTRNELHGCINDVKEMHKLLTTQFGFDPNHITVLTDATDSDTLNPTGANIRDELSKMIDQAEPGDIMFFHYSGHGTRIPSNHGHRHDEAIVPCDFNLITDVDFRRLVNRIPVGSSFTIISDSCHSGGLIDKEKEQIGPATVKSTSPTDHPKQIPFDTVMHHLASLSGIESSNVGDHLMEIFGTEASAKFHPDCHQLRLIGPMHPDSGILLSGCQANETSADMNPTVDGSKAYGAFSNAIQMVVKDHGSSLSNKDLVNMTREVLSGQAFDQHPCLYCSDENAGALFLSHPQTLVISDNGVAIWV